MEKNVSNQVSLAKQTLSVGRGCLPVSTARHVYFQHRICLICIWINLAYFPIIQSLMNNKHSYNQISQLFPSVG